jgi:hypothetical protein
MIGTIVLIMLLGWLACTVFMTILSGGTGQHPDTSEPRPQRISAGPAPLGTPPQDTAER